MISRCCVIEPYVEVFISDWANESHGIVNASVLVLVDEFYHNLPPVSNNTTKTNIESVIPFRQVELMSNWLSCSTEIQAIRLEVDAQSEVVSWFSVD